MIGTLEIRNFKSIKHLKQECRRVNVLIGEPNTGKSNMLEALGLVSFTCYAEQGSLRDFVRHERTTNLFYDDDLQDAVEVRFDGVCLTLKFEQGAFRGVGKADATSFPGSVLVGGYDSLSVSHLPSELRDRFAPIKFYRFAIRPSFPRAESEFLLPPSGSNLMALLLSNRNVKSAANQLFSSFGLRLNVRPQEAKIEVIKQMEGIVVSHPYSLASDTLQRLVFYLAAVLSNRNSVVVLEEPESHAFPYHTKFLAETIALDDRKNQYFISTHNPYFLLPLLEKCATEDIAISITYYQDYQTRTRLLPAKEMEEITEIDVFSNLDRFLGR